MTHSPPSPPEIEALDAEQQRDVKDLARGGLIMFVGKLGRISRGAFLWVITLLMGLDVQGYYTLSWSIVSTLNKIARFGMSRGVVRFVVAGRFQGGKEAERAIATALVIVVLCSLPVCLGIYLSADAIAAFYDKPIIAPALRIMAFSAPFMAVCWVFVAAIRALRIVQYDVYVMSVAGPLLLLFGGAVAGGLGAGLKGIAWVQLGMAIGISLLALYFFARFFSLRDCLVSPTRRSWREMVHFSFPVMVTDLLYALLTQLDVLMLGFFFSAEMVGIYALARRIASAMLKAPQAFDPMFSSIVSELALGERYAELSVRFRVLLRWILTINLPIFASLLIVGDLFLTLLGGADMQALPETEIAAGLKVLFVLSISMMLQGSFALAEPLLTMAGRPYLNFLNNGIWLCTNFVLNLCFIHYYGFGILGAALGALIATILVNLLRLIQIRRKYDIWPFDSKQLKPLLAALLAGIGGWMVREWVATALWSAVAGLAVFILLYILVLFFAGMEKEDRILVDKGLQRARVWWGN